MKKYSLLIFCFVLQVLPIQAQIFEHPGVLNREADFARMREKVAKQQEPWITAWNNLLAAPEAQLDWSPRATETIIRGGTGENVSLLYRDVAAAYAHALIYKINGDTDHGNKAVEILNAWSSIHKTVSGNADRYLASGLFGYQMANAAELMRDYPGFDLEAFKTYLLQVYYYPLNERFVLGNNNGTAHNDAVSTNYRVNWDICNMNAMLAISIFCDNLDNFNKTLDYAKSGDGNGNIHRAVNYIHSDIWGQWEESGRDQGHAMGGTMLYGLFCEMAWNQGIDFYAYEDSRYCKGAEYVARYNILENEAGKYDDLPFTSYTFQQGPLYSPRWTTEAALSESVRGKYGSAWQMIYNHYAIRMQQSEKVQSIHEILEQQPSNIMPSVSIHPDTYDTPGVGALTFATDSGSYIKNWQYMDVAPRNIQLRLQYGKTRQVVEGSDTALQLLGSGTGVDGQTDDFHFAFQRMVDDGELITRISLPASTDTALQAGIMIRENLYNTAKNVYLNVNAENGFSLSSRSIENGNTVKRAPVSMEDGEVWFSLQRVGDIFMAKVSADSVQWKTIGEVQMDMDRVAYIGLAVSSKNTATLHTCTFHSIQIKNGNQSPVVTLNLLQSDDYTHIAPAVVQIDGQAVDVDGNIAQLQLFVNGEFYAELNPDELPYYWRNVEEGTYEVYLQAMDNDSAVSQSEVREVNVDVATDKLPYYSFEQKNPIYAMDDSGNSCNAQMGYAPQYVDGKKGNGLLFNGESSYLKILNMQPEKLSDFTFSAWVYAESITQWARIFDWGSGTGAYMFLSLYGSNNTLRFEITTVDGRTQNADANRSLPLHTWAHTAVTLSNDTVTFYLNGNAIGQTTGFTVKPYHIGATTLNYIARSQFSADPYFDGVLDEVKVFNTALSQQEVQSVMNEVNTAVEEVHSPSIQVYTNAEKGKVQVRFVAQPGSIRVYNMQGQLVQTIAASDVLQTLNLQESGVLVLQVTEGEKNQSFKIIHLP